MLFPVSTSDLRAAIDAAASGDVLTLGRLLEHDPSLVRGGHDMPQPLPYAVRYGHVDAVRLLLEAGATPDHIGGWGDTLVETARDRGFEDIARILEDAHQRISRVRPSETHIDHPIHVAAESGDLKRVRAFLDADPSLVHRSDRSGGTALHRSVIGHAPRVVALLLDRGADIHAVHGAGLGSRNGYAPENLQPIDLAIWGGPSTVPQSKWRSIWRHLIGCIRWFVQRRAEIPHVPYDVETARLLVSRGAAYDLPIAAALGDRDRITAILDQDPIRIREARPNARLALSAAAEFGHTSLVRLLLERGADPTWPDADDSIRGAALHAAARAGNRELCELLLAHGADPNGFVDAAGNAVFAARTNELRALMIAHGGTIDPYDLVWMNEDDEVMRRVMEDPESAHAGCGGVYTAVVTRGKRALLTRLLDAGVKVNPVAGGCQSYVLEHPDMLRQLLAHGGLTPDYPTASGLTLLHNLCSRDIRNRTMAHRTECAAILLDAGADISAKEEEYRSTPLAWAARNNLPDMVEFLLARGAPTNLADDEPWATPLAWAEKRGHAEIAAILRQHGATR